MNTLGNYITEYLEYCEYRKHLNVKSLKAYKIDLKQYDTFSCDLPEYLSRNTLDSFLTNLHKQYKPKSESLFSLSGIQRFIGRKPF